MLFFSEKLLSFLKYSNLSTSLLPSFFHCPLLPNLLEKLTEDKSNTDDVTVCLNWNFKTHIFQYLQQKRRSDIETWTID